MSPVTCAGALAAVKYLKQHDELRVQHQERAAKLKQMLKDHNLPVMESETHIVPVLVGDAFKCEKRNCCLSFRYVELFSGVGL